MTPTPVSPISHWSGLVDAGSGSCCDALGTAHMAMLLGRRDPSWLMEMLVAPAATWNVLIVLRMHGIVIRPVVESKDLNARSPAAVDTDIFTKSLMLFTVGSNATASVVSSVVANANLLLPRALW